MQALILLVIVAVVTTAAALIAARFRHASLADRRWPRLLLGIVPGLVGSLLVAVMFSDLVPDGLEGGIWLLVAIAVGTALVLGTAWRTVRG